MIHRYLNTLSEIRAVVADLLDRVEDVEEPEVAAARVMVADAVITDAQRVKAVLDDMVDRMQQAEYQELEEIVRRAGVPEPAARRYIQCTFVDNSIDWLSAMYMSDVRSFSRQSIVREVESHERFTQNILHIDLFARVRDTLAAARQARDAKRRVS